MELQSRLADSNVVTSSFSPQARVSTPIWKKRRLVGTDTGLVLVSDYD